MNKEIKPEKKEVNTVQVEGSPHEYADVIYGYNQSCEEWEPYHKAELRRVLIELIGTRYWISGNEYPVISVRAVKQALQSLDKEPTKEKA